MPRTVTVTRKPRDPAPDSRESPEDLRSRIATLEGDLKTKQQLGKDLEKEVEKLKQRAKSVKGETQDVKKEITRLRKTLALSALSGIEEENEKRLQVLPSDVWSKIFDQLEENDLFPAASTCRFFRKRTNERLDEANKKKKGSLKIRTNLVRKTYEPGRGPVFKPTSLNYIKWIRAQKGLTQIDAQDRAEVLKVLAALHGHLDFLRTHLDKKLKSKQGFRTLDSRIVMAAARGGHLHVLKWLQNAPGPGKGPNLTSEVLGSAAEGGHLDVIRWLRSKGCPWNELTSNKAAAAGSLESLEFLRRHGCPFGQASFSAASTGQIKVLEWLRRQGLLRVEPMTCAAAATGGELECLEYLKSASFPFDRNATLMAVRNGQLNSLEWLLSNGKLELDVHMCDEAAASGNLNTLKWLRKAGCPGDSGCWAVASDYLDSSQHREIMAYCRANGCPGLPTEEEEEEEERYFRMQEELLGGRGVIEEVYFSIISENNNMARDGPGAADAYMYMGSTQGGQSGVFRF